MLEATRRTASRYDRKLEITLIVGEQRRTEVTRNISLGGAFVDTPDLLPLGSRLTIELHLPGAHEAIRVGAEVRWTETGHSGGTPGMGLRFEGLRAREVWALNRYFQS